MIIALTGGTGFLGAATLTQLLDAGHTVRALTRRPQATRLGVDWVPGTLTNAPALDRLCASADAVIHVAGVTNAPDAAAFDAGNRAGTVAMIEAADQAGIARFVHVSSLAARLPALSNYGASKRAGEDAVVASSLDWVVVRPPGIYGPGELRDLFTMAKSGVMVMPPNGRASWIHVDDTARLLVALVSAKAGRCIYEPDDGREGGWTHPDFARAIGIAVGKRVRIVAMPAAALYLAARVDRLVRGTRAELTADRVAYMVHPDWTVDPARRPPADLWTPQVDTSAGLAATARWFRDAGLL